MALITSQINISEDILLNQSIKLNSSTYHSQTAIFHLNDSIQEKSL
ncbi:MAG: hypothetical protein LBQ59_00745 [Candidatus Peribacteria bacterium]|nr:hypothetical protein [Candidatus Peribacteria bacterium]